MIPLLKNDSRPVLPTRAGKGAQSFVMRVALAAVALAGAACAMLPDAAATPAPPAACWKDAEDRGRGVLPEKGQCAAGLEKSMGLCYHKCDKPNTKGLGPLCWDECKAPLPISALFFCCKDEKECSELVSDIARKIPEALIKFGIDIAVNPANILAILKELRELVHDTMELNLPMCKAVIHEPLSDAMLGSSSSSSSSSESSSSRSSVVIASV